MTDRPDSALPHVSLRDIREGGTSEQYVRDLAARIWATPKAQRCAGDSLCRVLGEGEPDRSQYYFITLSEGQVAGVVGHYEIGGRQAGLAWSGLLPEYRGQGIYRAALSRLEEAIAPAYPKADILVEIVPPGPRHDQVVQSFYALGFEKRGVHRDSDPDYDNATILWRQIASRGPRWKCRGRYIFDSWDTGLGPPSSMAAADVLDRPASKDLRAGQPATDAAPTVDEEIARRANEGTLDAAMRRKDPTDTPSMSP